MWRKRYLNELYMLYDELDIAKVGGKLKKKGGGGLMCLGQLFRLQELDPCRELTVLKPEATPLRKM